MFIIVYYKFNSKEELINQFKIAEDKKINITKNFDIDKITFPTDIIVEQKFQKGIIVGVDLIHIDNYIENNNYTKSSLELNNDLPYRNINLIHSVFKDEDKMKILNIFSIYISGILYSGEEAIGIRTPQGDILVEDIIAFKF